MKQRQKNGSVSYHIQYTPQKATSRSFGSILQAAKSLYVSWEVTRVWQDDERVGSEERKLNGEKTKGMRE